MTFYEGSERRWLLERQVDKGAQDSRQLLAFYTVSIDCGVQQSSRCVQLRFPCTTVVATDAVVGTIAVEVDADVDAAGVGSGNRKQIDDTEFNDTRELVTDDALDIDADELGTA